MSNTFTFTRLNKVPQITAVFWLIKILTTGMGEALADFFDHAYEPILVVGSSGLLLVAVLWLQIRAKRYVSWLYWASVSMVSVFGTLAADAVHVLLGVPYWVSSVGFFLSILAIFFWWQRSEGSISIASITTLQRELFYWFVVMATFALGTAAGDMTAINFGWGFWASGLIFSALFALPLLLSSAFNSEAAQVAIFWIAYVITRPMGASFADWLALPADRNGLGFGTLPVSLALIVAIALFVFVNRKAAKATT